MHVTTAKENSTAHSRSQPSKPFFSKGEEGGFLSPTKESEQAFFTPAISSQAGAEGGDSAVHIPFFQPRPKRVVQTKLKSNGTGDRHSASNVLQRKESQETEEGQIMMIPQELLISVDASLLSDEELRSRSELILVTLGQFYVKTPTTQRLEDEVVRIAVEVAKRPSDVGRRIIENYEASANKTPGGLCYATALKRVKQAYTDILGVDITKSMHAVKTKREFDILWGSIVKPKSVWLKLPEKYRGKGAAGAMAFAEKGTIVEQEQIWSGALLPGAVLQTWKLSADFDRVKEGKEANDYGHSFIFLRYKRRNNIPDAEIEGMEIADQGFQSQGVVSKDAYEYWVAANVTGNLPSGRGRGEAVLIGALLSGRNKIKGGESKATEFNLLIGKKFRLDAVKIAVEIKKGTTETNDESIKKAINSLNPDRFNVYFTQLVALYQMSQGMKVDGRFGDGTCRKLVGKPRKKALSLQSVSAMPFLQPSLQRQVETSAKIQFRTRDTGVIQRTCVACEQKTKVQRQQEMEEEQTLQTNALMRKAEGNDYTASPQFTSRLSSTKGGGSPLPQQTLGFMNQAFGADFSKVRVHTGSQAAEMSQGIQAKAFTHGSDIFFNRGQYSPESSEGKRLLGHELTHVVQQASIHPNQRQHNIVQREPSDKKTFVPHKVYVNEPMTQEEYKIAAMRQVFGREMENVVWSNLSDSYVPEKSPYTLYIDIRLLKKQRGQASKERGISMGEEGGVTGAEERAKTFHAGPESDEKSALMKEIDRRYFEAVGDKTGTKIKEGEKAKAELWRMIRDEVLFQQEYIANLPPQVKELIKFSTKGKDLVPADYDKLFAIAKKIEKMPAGQVGDYVSKVTGTTTDLDVFEESLDKYIADMATRSQEGAEREKIQTKLIGLEEVYKKYKLYKTLLLTGAMTAVPGPYSSGGGGIVNTLEASKMRKELEVELQAHGFAGVTEFEAFIKKFEEAFEKEAANIAKDLLKKYAGKLYRESERYKDPAEVAALHQKLGGVRANYVEFEANAKIWNEYVKASMKAREQARIPGQGHLKTSDYTSITPSEAEAARKKAEVAKSASESQVKGMSGDHPIFQEEGLPLDKRIDKVALAKASESELGGLLQGHIQNRMKDIHEARTEIEGKTELIYKMDKLMPHFYVQQGIKPGSIHDMIIQDKMREDAILKLVKGIALAIVAVALAVVSFGTATPAIIAAGAAIAGAGLGVYMALEEYQEYTQQKNLADVGLADDPSIVWVVIAVVGAGLDMAAAVKAVKALGPAAKVFNSSGDLAEFTKAVRALEQANEIEAKIARAAEKAAAARIGFTEATTDLTKAMAGKVYSFPGPLADPEVYKAVVKMARQAIKTKIYDAQKFIEEIKLARVNAKLGDLSPQELAKAKQAWEEAKLLEAAEEVRYQKLLQQIPDATKLDSLIAKAGDVEKLERLLKTFPVAELETIFANLSDSGRLVMMLDHIGADTSAGMIRQWMAKGKIAQMNEFMGRLAGGVSKELAETAAVGGKSVIIDSQTLIALSKDAKAIPLSEGEKIMVKYIKSLPPGTELRVGNVTIGEVGSEAVAVKGLPLKIARDSTDYKKVLSELERINLGGGKGAADRALVADAFFAKTEPGVVPQFATADKNIFNKLATEAGIDLKNMGGKKLSALHPGGFDVSIAGQKLHVIPIEP